MPINVSSPPPPPGNLLYSATGTSLNQAVNMTTDGVKGYLVIWKGNANGNVSIELNGDATATNYYIQRLLSQSTSAAATNANSNVIETPGAGVTCNGYFYVLLNTTEQKITCIGVFSGGATTNTKLMSFYLYYTTAAANITNIKVAAASNFAATTNFYIYGVKN